MRFSKPLAVLLSVALMFSFVSPAFAEELLVQPADDEINEVIEPGSSEDANGSDDADEGTNPEELENLEEGNLEPEVAIDPQTFDEELDLMAGEYAVAYSQNPGTTEVVVSLPNIVALKALGAVDSVTIEATMNYGGKITRNVKLEKPLVEINDSDPTFTVDFTTYGKFSVAAKFYSGASLVKTESTPKFGVVADEYNIAPVSASLPVAFFSLSLWGADNIRYDNSGTVVPTIMLMERPAAYNWDSLPEGVYGLPYLTEAEVAYQPADFDTASRLFRTNTEAMDAYVADLYDLNPSAKFNVYLVDYYVGLAQSIIYANKIPETQYTLNVLSDGSFSYAKFTSVYSGANPSATHQDLINKWNTAKAAAYSSGQVSSGFKINGPNSSLYAAVDADPNASWWIARASNLVTNDDGGAFGTTARSNPKVRQISIAQKLTSLQNEGATAIQEFKALYNFSDTYFSEAQKNGKEVMLFLGTTVWNENGDFSDYARFVMAHCGDDYQYYYKGHPGTPTDFYPEKQEELELLGITDVDSSIAAELILFFYPDLYLSGYTSSTYASMTDADMAKGLFRLTKTEALSDTSSNYSMMDFFISPVTTNTDSKIRALCKQNDNNFLVEFSDAELQTVDYSIAIWNSTTSTITYYLLENGSYKLVRTVQAGGSFIDGGVYTIESKSAVGKALDIAGASTANAANVQIYDNNQSLAQTFRLNHAGGGYYTIQNAKSGKMLDVQGASTTPGANVWQYDSNKTDAQRWKLVPTGDSDGSYYVVSKCNGLYLDQQWGGTGNGTNIWVYTGNSSNAQKFVFKKITPLLGESGSFTIGSALSPSITLDVTGASKANGANVQIYRKNATDAQIFDLAYDASTGYYTIKNRASGKALDVMGAGFTSGTNVWQYTSNNSSAQKWRIKMVGSGYYVLYSATGGGCCLDIAGASTNNSTNVQIYAPNGTNAQKWCFDAI